MGGTESRRIEPSSLSCEPGERMRGSLEGVRGLSLEMAFRNEIAFQAIFEAHFPYSITSTLSKVRHSNTLFLTISFAFPCRGGGGHLPPRPPPPTPLGPALEMGTKYSDIIFVNLGEYI